MLVKEFLDKLRTDQTYIFSFRWNINHKEVQVDTEFIEAAYHLFQDEEIGEESSIFFENGGINIYINRVNTK